MRFVCYSMPMEKNIYAVSYKLRRELYHQVFTVLLTVIICISLVSLFLTYILFPVRNTTVSMTPDVCENAFEMVCPLVKTPRRGDVMLISGRHESKKTVVQRFVNTLCRFVTAQQWYPFEIPGRTGSYPAIRRVIALPGDTIYMNQYVTYIKPKGQNHFLTEFELTEAKYNVNIAVAPKFWDLDLGVRGKMTEMTLGEHEYFVLGDNRLESSDSRVWGVVSESEFKGKVLFQYLPFNRFRLF